MSDDRVHRLALWMPWVAILGLAVSVVGLAVNFYFDSLTAPLPAPDPELRCLFEDVAIPDQKPQTIFTEFRPFTGLAEGATLTTDQEKRAGNGAYFVIRNDGSLRVPGLGQRNLRLMEFGPEARTTQLTLRNDGTSDLTHLDACYLHRVVTLSGKPLLEFRRGEIVTDMADGTFRREIAPGEWLYFRLLVARDETARRMTPSVSQLKRRSGDR